MHKILVDDQEWTVYTAQDLTTCCDTAIDVEHYGKVGLICHTCRTIWVSDHDIDSYEGIGMTVDRLKAMWPRP